MRQLAHEFAIYYTNKMVRLICLAIPVYVILIDRLLGMTSELLLVAPGLVAHSSFGVLFGVIVIFLTALVWEHDLRHGTIKNVLSAGVGRFRYCANKLVFVFAIDIMISFVMSLSGLFAFSLKGRAADHFSVPEVIKGNVSSFLTVLLIAAAYSFCSSIIFVYIENYMVALLVAELIPVFDAAVSGSLLDSIELSVTPFDFFLKTIMEIEAMDIDGSLVRTGQGAIIMLIYIAIGTVLSFVFCIRREY